MGSAAADGIVAALAAFGVPERVQPVVDAVVDHRQRTDAWPTDPDDLAIPPPVSDRFDWLQFSPAPDDEPLSVVFLLSPYEFSTSERGGLCVHEVLGQIRIPPSPADETFELTLVAVDARDLGSSPAGDGVGEVQVKSPSELDADTPLGRAAQVLRWNGPRRDAGCEARRTE